MENLNSTGYAFLRFVRSRARLPFLCLLLTSTVFLPFPTLTTYAQNASPVVVFSWKSHTFVPSGYSGKALPVYGSRVELAADLLVGSSFVDPGTLFYSWSLNGSRLASGKGLRKTEFIAKSGPGASNYIRVEIDFLEQKITKNFFVESSEPRVVVEQQHSRNMLQGGQNLFIAKPFFFLAASLADFSFLWSFNGSPLDQKLSIPDRFSVDILPGTPSGSPVGVGVEIQNKTNLLEIASRNLSLVVQ
jgi:hypothetical protein